MTMNITQTTVKTAQFRALLELPVTDLIQLVNQAYETEAIAYWVAYARDAERGEPDMFGHPNVYQFNLEAQDDEETYHVDVNTMRDGIQAILNGLHDTTYVKGYILRAVVEQDLGYIDSDALDQIVQAGVFGSIVYG
jgi:hypothetical protein